MSFALAAELGCTKTSSGKVGGVCGGLSFHCLFPAPSGTRLPLPSPIPPLGCHAHLRTGRLAHLLLCQWGPSYRCSRSDIASQDFSLQDVYLERNSPWVLLTHTLMALPDSQGSGSTRWPPAICGLSTETAAVAAGESGWPSSEPAESQPRSHPTYL